MSFSATSGNTITQAQTDADLSGLSGVAGVTINAIGGTGYRTYTITRKLIVLGTLTIDPAKELLLIDNSQTVNIQINGSGVLNIGVPGRTSANSATGATAGPLYGDGLGLVSGVDGPPCCWNGSVNVESGGTLALYGSMMRVRSVMHLKSGANFISRDGKILVEPPSNVGSNVCRIRVDATSGVDILGLTVWGAQFDILSASPFTNFEGYDGRNVAVPVEASPNASNRNLRGTLINVRAVPDFRPYSQAAMNNWRGAQDLRITNSAAGSATLCVPDQVEAETDAGEGAFGGRIYQEATVTVTDENGDPVEGARVYMRDTDNGARVRATTTGSVTIDETADKIYSELTDALGQRMLTVLTGMWYRKNAVSDIAAPDGNEQVDIRSKTNTAGVDDFDFYVEAYGYQGTAFEGILHGTESYLRTVSLRPNLGITEMTKATVAAYAEWETAAKLFDGIFSAKTDDPTLGGLGASIVRRNGNTLDFGDLNVVFADPTSHASPRASFNADNTEITIVTRNANFTGNIRTSGTVTIHDDQTLTGFISDANGTTSVVAVSVATTGNIAPSPSMAAFGPNGDLIATNQQSNGTFSSPWTLLLTPSQSQRGIRIVAKEIGHAQQVQRLDASAGGAFSVDFAPPKINELLVGGLMRVTTPAPDTSGISVAFGVSDIADVTMTITIPDRQVRVQEVYEAVEQAFHAETGGVIETDGLKFLAFGGEQVWIDLSPTGGDSLYLNYSGTKIDAAAGATANAIVQGNVGHPDRRPVLGDGSDPNIQSGANIEILSDAMSRAVLWRDIDPDEIGDQSLAEKVLDATAAVTDAAHGNAALKVLIDAITGTVGGIETSVGQSGGVTETQLNTARDAIISALRGTGTGNTLTSIQSSISGLPDPATQAEVSTAVQAAISALRGSGTNTFATIVSAIEGLKGTDATLDLTQLLIRIRGEEYYLGDQDTRAFFERQLTAAGYSQYEAENILRSRTINDLWQFLYSVLGVRIAGNTDFNSFLPVLQPIQDESIADRLQAEHDATQALAGTILAAINPDIDGTKNRNEILKEIYAILAGNAVIANNGNRVTFKQADGTTDGPSFDLQDDGTRTRRTG